MKGTAGRYLKAELQGSMGYPDWHKLETPKKNNNNKERKKRNNKVHCHMDDSFVVFFSFTIVL